MNMTHIYINGLSTETSCQTLADLVIELNLQGKRFAVECNTQIVPKSKLSQHLIQTNDRIEIIHAVGGG